MVDDPDNVRLHRTGNFRCDSAVASASSTGSSNMRATSPGLRRAAERPGAGTDAHHDRCRPQRHLRPGAAGTRQDRAKSPSSAPWASRARAILRIFLMCGIGVGIVGTAVGVGLAVLFCDNIEAIRSGCKMSRISSLFPPDVLFPEGTAGAALRRQLGRRGRALPGAVVSRHQLRGLAGGAARSGWRRCAMSDVQPRHVLVVRAPGRVALSARAATVTCPVLHGHDLADRHRPRRRRAHRRDVRDERHAP